MHQQSGSQQINVTEMQVLMERESANPEFGFMFNLQSPEHMYFRWRLYSLAQGMLTVQPP
jgi:Surp module